MHSSGASSNAFNRFLLAWAAVTQEGLEYERGQDGEVALDDL